MTQQNITQQFIDTRQQFLNGLDGLTEQEITQPQVEGEWTIKDIIGHLASWQELCLKLLIGLATGKPYTPPDIPDGWNDKEATRKRSIPLDKIKKEFSSIYEEMLAETYVLTPKQWEQKIKMPWGELATIGEMLNGLAMHEEEHLKAIQKWLAKKSIC